MLMKAIYLSESQLERKFYDSVKRIGGLPLKFISPGRAGVPDRIVLMPEGKIYFVELKKPNGKISMIQDYIFKNFAALGFKVHIINSVESLEKFLKVITDGTSNF